MAVARRVVVNPSNPDQRYVLWSNGYIEAKGSAVPITQYETASVNNANTLPVTFEGWPNPDPAISLTVTNWTTPAGYVGTIYGHVWRFGGAAAIPGAANHFAAGGAPEYLFGTSGGSAQPTFGGVIDHVFNPAFNGQGFQLEYGGRVSPFGTGVASVGGTNFLTDTAARALQLDWTSKRYAVLDNFGRVWGLNGLTSPPVGGGASSWGSALTAPAFLWGRGGRFAEGGFRIYDFTAASAKGWVIDAFGRAYKVGTATEPSGHPGTNVLSRVYRDIAIIDDGLGANPLRLAGLTANGALVEWVVSTAPTVTVVEPADPTTLTTRPFVRWTYLDAQNNPQASYQVRVFTSAQYSAGGFNPASSAATWETSGTDPNVRSVQPTIDLPNTTYRAYVFTTDTSGLASTASFKQWVQNVTAMSVPTVTPTVLGGLSGISLGLSVATGGLDPLAKFAVQYHDADWDGATWEFVRGGDGVTITAGAATLVDREARFGVLRSYRVLIFVYDSTTGNFRASQWSTITTATLSPRNIWTLTNPFNAAQGATVRVQPGFSISRPVRNAVFWPSGRRDPIVVTDGMPKYGSGDVTLWALTNGERVAVEAMVDADVPLLLRDPFGRAWYVRLDEAFEEEVVRASPVVGEVTSIRDMHEISFHVQAIKRPLAGPSAGPLAEAV